MIRGISTLIWMLLSIFGAIACVVSALFLSLPNPEQIKTCMTTAFKHVRLCPRDPTYTPLSQVTPLARSAIMISEDASFYSHSGFDWYEIRQSAEKDFTHKGFARGGSTITQQLAKNVFLSGEKSLWRKMKEAYLTWRLENILTKDQIFEKYLNVVEFGPGIFGIRAASEHYFKVEPSQLDAAEASFLAFLLPNPIKYYVSFRAKKLTPFARKRLTEISHKLVLFGKITDADYEQVIASLDQFPWTGNLVTPVPADDPANQLTPEESADQIENDINTDAP